MGGNILKRWATQIEKKAERLMELKCDCKDTDLMHGCERFSVMRDLEMEIGREPLLLLMIIRGWKESKHYG